MDPPFEMTYMRHDLDPKGHGDLVEFRVEDVVRVEATDHQHVEGTVGGEAGQQRDDQLPVLFHLTGFEEKGRGGLPGTSS